MIVIIGASRGIGKYLFDEFTQHGKRVVGTYYEANQDLEENENFYQLDNTKSEQIEALVESLEGELTEITLINCAGINYNAFAHKSDINAWTEVINTNLIGTFNVIRCFLPIMRAQGYGRIINFSSVVSQKGVMGTSAYAAAKSGMIGMSKAIAVENATKGITINNLNLGYMDIGMLYDIPEAMREDIRQSIPQQRFGDRENILNSVEYLMKSDYVTGTSIDVNGGLI